VPLLEVITLLGVGFAAGLLGGLLGIGGSIIIIPVLTLIFSHNQHLSQAAAMIVNFFVAVGAMIQHQRSRSVDWRFVQRVLPAGIICILLGVRLSNEIPSLGLKRAFGAFLIYVIFMNVRRLFDRRPPEDRPPPRDAWWATSLVGAITGFAAGLLGIGGGILTVPLLQRVCNLRLRHAIVISSALMCITSLFGAIYKNYTLDQAHSPIPLDGMESLLIAMVLTPSAILGALLGARLTHVLPRNFVRVIFIVLATVAAVRFLTAEESREQAPVSAPATLMILPSTADPPDPAADIGHPSSAEDGRAAPAASTRSIA
jgi:uncharacterized membrane protein YfcA